MKKVYKHTDKILNTEIDNVYKNISTVNSEAKKQRSIITVKSFPSSSTMKEGILYIDDNFDIKIKKGNVVKQLTLTEV